MHLLSIITIFHLCSLSINIPPDSLKANITIEKPLCFACAGMANGTPCDDGNPCTINDVCINGICAGTPKNCNDDNPCTDDFCDINTGQCFYINNNSNTCSDGSFCTVNDYCLDGVCISGQLVICEDFNLCTTEFCSPSTGCVTIFNSNPCDDGNPCTINDVCINGNCTGTPKNCNDGDPCTDDYCDFNTGNCVHVLHLQKKYVTSKLDYTIGSLRNIIENSCEGDTISFTIDTSFVTSAINISHSITFIGNGINTTYFDGKNTSRIFTIAAGSQIEFRELSFINGFEYSNGGAFYNLGNVSLQYVDFKNNFEGGIRKAFTSFGAINILAPGTVHIFD